MVILGFVGLIRWVANRDKFAGEVANLEDRRKKWNGMEWKIGARRHGRMVGDPNERMSARGGDRRVSQRGTEQEDEMVRQRWFGNVTAWIL